MIAEAVLRDLETKAMEHLQPHFWTRHVDDTFVDKSRFLDVLNGVCADIQFTMEEEVDPRLPFLDIQFTCNEATGRPLTNESAPEGNSNELSTVCL